jgi:hypothetical protein
MSFIAILKDDISIKLEMEHHLFNHIISFEKAVLVWEFSQIVRGLRIVRIERFNDLLFFLFSRQLFLIDATHLVILIHV